VQVLRARARALRVQVLRVQVLRVQVLRVQVLRVQVLARLPHFGPSVDRPDDPHKRYRVRLRAPRPG